MVLSSHLNPILRSLPMNQQKISGRNSKSNKSTGDSKKDRYFQYYYNERAKQWFYNKALNRELLVIFNRLRANHYSLTAPYSRSKC